MSTSWPQLRFMHLILGCILVAVGLCGCSDGPWGASDSESAAVEVDREPAREPDPEDDHDQDDDALARGEGADADPAARAALWLTNRFAHPSAALEQIFRPPIA